MASTLGTVQLSGCSYELAYDLLGQNSAGNYSNVRFYGILHVPAYVSWTRGYASVHTSGLQTIGTYYGAGNHVVITWDFTFQHDNAGNFSAYIGASLSTTYTSGDTGGILTLPQIIRQANMTSSINVNDEQNPSFTFSNPAGYDIFAELEINPTNTHLFKRYISNTGSYTFNLTDEEREIMRSYLPKSNTATLRYLLYSNNGQFVSYQDKTYTIINANPQFNNFEFEDINPITLALTGNNQYNINGYSNIKATIPIGNKAEALKKASMSRYRFVIDTSSVDINYSDDEEVSGVINNAINGTYNVYAIDSRNNSTLVTKFAEKEITYNNISIDTQNSNISRDNNQVGKNAILTLNGTFWNDDFGQVINNIKNVTYRLKKTNSSEWIEGTTKIIPEINENSFTFTGEIASDNDDTSWDLESSYDIQITVSDELSSATINLILNSAIPTLSLDREGIGVMCAYNKSLGGLLQVGGKVVGEEVFSTEEIKTNMIWIDGSSFYKKTYVIPNPGTGEWTFTNNLPHKIAFFDMSHTGLLRSSGSMQTGIGADGNSGYWFQARTINKSGDLLFYVGENIASGATIYATVLYTKTTD